MASVPEMLTYRGQLSRTGGFAEIGENLTLTFRIYDSAAPGTVLWGRSVVVAVDKDGVFYAELKDDNGAAVQGAAHTSLVDAVAAFKAVIHAVQSRECEDRRKDLEAKKEAEAKVKDNGGKVEAPAAKPMRLMERFGRTLARFGIPLPSSFTHSDNNFK